VSVTEWFEAHRPSAALVRARAWLADTSHHSLAQRVAGAAFLIRVAAAALAYLSQIALARWMGTYEFGVYVYVWTWALLIGNIADAGLANAAQRFIPEYTEHKQFALLRGYIAGSRRLALAIATALGVIAALAITLGAPFIDNAAVIPLYLACLCLPVYAFQSVQDGVARCYNWVGVGQIPTFVIRPVLLLVLMGGAHAAGLPTNATTAVLCTVISFWLIGIIQTLLLNRRLAATIAPGAASHDTKRWIATSLPIITVVGFYVMLTYVDVIILQMYRPADSVAYYHAATKTLALVAFVYFSVSAATAHRFSAYHAAGDRDRLKAFVASAVRWTFWPSLALVVALLVFGRPLLMLFGSDFAQAYPLLFLLAIGLLARASVGPSERLLSMLGEQRACAVAYASAFAFNLAACLLLIPDYGAIGAAVATSLALVVESVLLFVIVKWRLGVHAFIWGGARHS
jgi:O-antigen/teichoic acid export membrane protein